IAVAAPYANNNTGVVYIYNGDSRGLTLSQEIHGNQVHPELKGFGISISRGVDIDNNGYPDVAVGAYLSDQAVILRAQPVVCMSTNVTANVSELQKDTNNFIIRVCLLYTQRVGNVPNTLKVDRNITVDEKLRRAYFVTKKNTETSSIEITNNIYCEEIEVFLMTSALEENALDPVTVKVTQEINNLAADRTTVFIANDSLVKSRSGFKRDFAVVSEKCSSQSAMLNVPFTVECRDENECEAQLMLNATFTGITNGSYVIGSNSSVKLLITVTNKRQPAYRTEVKISIPEPLQLSSGHKSCRETHSLFLKNLTLDLDTSTIKPGSKNLTFFISVSTSSRDINKARNSQQLELKYIVDADMVILGRSEELVYSYANTNKTVFKHRHEVQKRGASSIEVVEVELNVPTTLTMSDNNETTFVHLFRPKAYLNSEQELTCVAADGSYEYYLEESTQSVESLNIINSRRKRETQLTLQTNNNNSLYLNCSTSGVKCVKIKCFAGPFDSNMQDSASVELKMVLNITNLAEILGEKTTIYFATEGSVVIKEPKITQLTS
ncbi:hypothetical protein L9F63_003277, partial [Diploptera punctata]